MELLFDSLAFGVALALMIIGLIGSIIPMIPGPILMLITVLSYSWYDGFQAPNKWVFSLIMLILLVTSSADFWLPLVGAKASGASRRSMVYGVIGGIIGLFVGTIFGSIVGYALGVLLGAYQTHRDWEQALKASLGGLAGQGVAVMIQFGGGIIVFVLFIASAL